MAKSILQEVATLNARSFNEAKLKVNLFELEKVIEQHSELANSRILSNEADLSINLNELEESVANELEELKVANVKLQVKITNVKTFALSEFASNYHEIGKLKKHFDRQDHYLDDRIDNERLNKLEYFTGPKYVPEIDSVSDFKTGYTGAKTDDKLVWMYIRGKDIRYADGSLLTLNGVGDLITIGDTGLYKKVFMTGDLTVQNDFKINAGIASITSPNNTDNSLTVNGNIISTSGYSLIKLGYTTDTGGFTATTSGDFTSNDGGVEVTTGMHTSGGDIKTDTGFVIAKTGVQTTSGGFVATNGPISTGTGNISTVTGNITTNSGNVHCSKGYTTDTIGYVATSGNFKTSGGGVDVTTNITSSGGFCHVSSGFETKRGGLNITEKGAIYTKEGNIQTDSGNLIVKGTGTFDKKLTVKDDGALFLGGTVTVGSTASNDDLKVFGKIESTDLGTFPDLQVNGDINLTGEITYGEASGISSNTHTSNGSLDVKADLEVFGELKVAGESTLKSKVTVTGGIKVDGSGSITGSSIDAAGDIDAYSFHTDTKFYGLATSAQYGDVAEHYLTDIKYEPGTVLSLGGDKEVTLYDQDLPLAGVVSTDPGVELNVKEDTTDDKYVFVALTGRIPVKTIQDIKKGSYIFPDSKNPGNVIGVNKKQLHSQNMLELIGISISDSKNNIVEVKV